MNLSPTAMVILGFLGSKERSGYDIKSEVDRSTRFFWAASYGQIYPELKRLKEDGLVEEVDGPQGERRRTAYRITSDGRQTLEDWLLGPAQILELRHEGLLKVFFADSLPRRRREELLGEIIEQHRAKLAELRKVADSKWPAEGQPSWDVVLRFGLEFQQWVIDWCEEEIERGESDVGSAGPDV